MSSDLTSPAAHAACAPDVPMRSAVLSLRVLPLEAGGSLERAQIGFSLYGDLRRPLVVVLGGISSGRDVRKPEDVPGRGWWQEFVGPGRAVDTDSFAVLGIDFLGGSGESTKPNGSGFPTIRTTDQASAITAVLDHLGIDRAHAIVGASYGGMVALAFASVHPARVDRIVVISAAHESHPMATALRTLQRRAVRLGIESGRVEEGLSIARGIAMTTYRTAEEFSQRFSPSPDAVLDGLRFPVEDYLEHQGASFARSFSPWSFLCLSESIDSHRVDPSLVRTPATLVAVENDSLVPTWQIRALAARIGGPRRIVEIPSIYGHDAFLKEVPVVSGIVRTTLAEKR